MDRDEIRQIVRDVLAEEIARATPRRSGSISESPRPRVREEVVSIRSDMELGAFVRRLAEILKDGRSREEIEERRWVFRLAPARQQRKRPPPFPITAPVRCPRLPPPPTSPPRSIAASSPSARSRRCRTERDGSSSASRFGSPRSPATG